MGLRGRGGCRGGVGISCWRGKRKGGGVLCVGTGGEEAVGDVWFCLGRWLSGMRFHQ